MFATFLQSLRRPSRQRWLALGVSQALLAVLLFQPGLLLPETPDLSSVFFREQLGRAIPLAIVLVLVTSALILLLEKHDLDRVFYAALFAVVAVVLMSFFAAPFSGRDYEGHMYRTTLLNIHAAIIGWVVGMELWRFEPKNWRAEQPNLKSQFSIGMLMMALLAVGALCSTIRLIVFP